MHDANPPTVRAFLGLPLTPAARAALEAALAGITLPGRALAPANWHITLVFLGQITPATMTALAARLDSVLGAPAQRITLGGGGAFPQQDSARVLWLDVVDSRDFLAALYQNVRALVVDLGLSFVRSSSPVYVPHLTLARTPPGFDMRPAIEQLATIRVIWDVDRIALFHAHRIGDVTRYEIVATKVLPLQLPAPTSNP